eukprot:CAMPEP_0116935888 /NCGR_PEP_ID=MMETSP0467-20121206/30555_1 /TAXON_ID=283647 /ORGANISM="Mesodinium pulex, Strain SPMC105" /LENGTH=45 /DNA_ID= /DNA_START= /DNA_END= /DNA_ORIENTATION=
MNNNFGDDEEGGMENNRDGDNFYKIKLTREIIEFFEDLKFKLLSC